MQFSQQKYYQSGFYPKGQINKIELSQKTLLCQSYQGNLKQDYQNLQYYNKYEVFKCSLILGNDSESIKFKNSIIQSQKAIDKFSQLRSTYLSELDKYHSSRVWLPTADNNYYLRVNSAKNIQNMQNSLQQIISEQSSVIDPLQRNIINYKKLLELVIQQEFIIQQEKSYDFSQFIQATSILIDQLPKCVSFVTNAKNQNFGNVKNYESQMEIAQIQCNNILANEKICTNLCQKCASLLPELTSLIPENQLQNIPGNFEKDQKINLC